MDPRIIAESAGYALVEDGDRLHFVDQGGGGGATAVFVLALISFLALSNGVVQIALGQALLGVILAGVGVVFGVVTQAVRKGMRARKARGPGGLPRIASVDLIKQELLDGSGNRLAPLSEVRFERVFQMGSSSRALAATWRGGQVVVARGNPFAGDVSPIEDGLRGRGLRV